MTPNLLRLCCATLLGLPLLAALPAHAQYAYIDDHGTRVFSDQPPPPGTPAKRILKAPRAAQPAAQETPAPSAATGDKALDAKAGAATANAPKAPPTLAEREADYAKRTKARQDSEAKQAEEQAKQAARDCPNLLRNEAELTSGRRTSRMNAAGQAEFVPDEDRDRMIAEARRAAARCR